MGKKIKLEDYTMSEERGVAKGLFLGFLAGGIVGGVLALLYAPKSGKELRQDIRNKKRRNA